MRDVCGNCGAVGDLGAAIYDEYGSRHDYASERTDGDAGACGPDRIDASARGIEYERGRHGYVSVYASDAYGGDAIQCDFEGADGEPRYGISGAAFGGKCGGGFRMQHHFGKGELCVGVCDGQRVESPDDAAAHGLDEQHHLSHDRGGRHVGQRRYRQRIFRALTGPYHEDPAEHQLYGAQ